MAKRILLLGAPGADKDTQPKRLAETYGIEHATTGDALRANRDMETEYGTPRSFMEKGELVPGAVVNEIIEAALEGVDGYALDGYPRNLSQTEYLTEITDLDAVIYLNVAKSELVERLTGRRVCGDCGTNFHVKFNQPEEEGVCDDCGGELVQRDDDVEKTARERPSVFEESTEPVIGHYRDEGVLVEVGGEQAPDEVFEDIQFVVDDA